MAERPDRAYCLRVGESPSEGMRRVARGQAERAVECLREAERAEDPSEPIHNARKPKAFARKMRRAWKSPS
ncbi:MAG TPA: hypothetical protein VFC52_07045 [Solirubrobacterales bacterium]|nr:hypothetical protein [Solirubrobacterales bacterium]